METEKLTPAALEAALKHFTGTEHYYRHKIFTDEDYDAMLVWLPGYLYAKILERYNEPPELYVVELDDANTFPTPTWGPFVGLADAQDFVAKLLRRNYVVADNFASGDIARSYEVDDGVYYHIKHLTYPN